MLDAGGPRGLPRDPRAFRCSLPARTFINTACASTNAGHEGILAFMIELTDISRPGSGGCGGGACGCGDDAQDSTHDSVIEALAQMQAGSSMVLLAEREPHGLLTRIGERFGDAVSWEDEAQGEGEHRLRFTKES